MTNHMGPAAQLEARANRAQQKLERARAELRVVAATITHSELPSEVKLRLMGALKAENDLLMADNLRLDGMRKAAEISRGKQWVTASEEG